MASKGKDFIEPELAWTREDYEKALNLAFDFKRASARGEKIEPLKGKIFFMLFYAHSLRTRTGIEAAMTQLGGQSQFISPEEELYSHEDIADVARVLSSYGDAIGIRTALHSNYVYGEGHEFIKTFAKYADIPVISLADEVFHPHEPLEELMTIKDRLGKLEGLKVVYSWAYAPRFKAVCVPQSLLLVWTKFGMDVTLAHPKGLELDPNIVEVAQRNARESGGSFHVSNDMDEAVKGADVVHAKSYTCLRLSPPNVKVFDETAARELFEKHKDWIMNEERQDLMNKGGIYLHCLPAYKGIEVTEGVIEGPRSAVWDNQRNRIHAKKAILLTAIGE